ncbi:phytase [Paenibacillus sp. MMS18-CY102]|nr:phytase [Paenibacillus sp. MMS18-CY102]
MSKLYKRLIVAGMIISLSMGSNALANGTQPVYVEADVETDAVSNGEDAADDPAIWLHPDDAEDSTIIATNKAGGLLVYDLEGHQKFSYSTGKMNNVDVRYGFPLGSKKVDIAAATNRTTNTVDIYAISPVTGALTNISGTPIHSNMGEVYGFSLYHSQRTGKFYALVLGKAGEFEQYELYHNGSGKINGTLVRSFQLGSQSEGMVADDEYGKIYIAEEDVGIWKYSAEPNAGNSAVQVAAVDNQKLTADVEGLTLYYGEDGEGYLIASSQGSSSYAIFDRENSNPYLGSFMIGDGDDTDGTSETDGIDVLNYDLGDEFSNGLFVAQDDENMENGVAINQNFKLVEWDNISDEFGSLVETLDSVDPRELEERQ